MRLTRIAAVLVILLVSTVFLASCGQEEEAEAVTVKVGLTAPLSGIAAGYGQDIKAGLDMAVDEINDEGGVVIDDTTYVFELVAADDAMVPEQALTNAQGFVLEDEINIIWDPTANTILSLMTINENPGEEFLIMAYTSTPLYTPPTVETPNSLMVTLPPPFATYVPEFIKLCMEEGWTRLGMLQTTGAYGDLWGQTMKTAWEGAGGTVVGEAPASYYTETDFTPFLTTVLAGEPDVIFAGGPSDPTALVIDQARGLGFEGGFIIIDQAKLDDIFDTVGIDKLEGCIGVLPFEGAEDEWPGVGAFAQRYEETFNERVTWETAISYTGFHVLVEAMKNAGSVDDVMAIRAAFNESSVTDTSVLPVGFFGINDQTGALLMPATSTMVKGGDFLDGEFIEWWME